MLIAICEDTPRDMEAIMDLCDTYANEKGYIVHTLMYGSPQKLLGDPKSRKADMLLLDIMMPGSDGATPAGIAIARQMRQEGYSGAIIFTTTSTDFYPEGFEVGATHYLIKPIAYEDFLLAMERAMQLVKHPERMITVPVNRIHVSIALSLIRYAEVYGRETKLYTTVDTVRVLLPLKRIEHLLEGDPFLRCYRSYIVNMDYIRRMEEDHFVLEGGDQIPISLRNRQALKQKYFSYRLANTT